MRKGRDGEILIRIRKKMMELVATNVVASRPPAPPTARAKIHPELQNKSMAKVLNLIIKI